MESWSVMFPVGSSSMSMSWISWSAPLAGGGGEGGRGGGEGPAGRGGGGFGEHVGSSVPVSVKLVQLVASFSVRNW